MKNSIPVAAFSSLFLLAVLYGCVIRHHSPRHPTAYEDYSGTYLAAGPQMRAKLVIRKDSTFTRCEVFSTGVRQRSSGTWAAQRDTFTLAVTRSQVRGRSAVNPASRIRYLIGFRHYSHTFACIREGRVDSGEVFLGR